MARLLITDDDEMVRDLCALILTQAGHDVTRRSNGMDGLDVLRWSPQDLLLTDLMMPHGGFMFIPEVRAEFPSLPIIVMSGNDERDLARALELGADATLAKPFTRARLCLTVDVLLRAGRPAVNSRSA
jgi:DNA-binding response OmpR family regulator